MVKAISMLPRNKPAKPLGLRIIMADFAISKKQTREKNRGPVRFIKVMMRDQAA